MVGSAAAVYAHNDPVMTACNAARNTDAEIRDMIEQQFEAVLRQIVGVVEAEMQGRHRAPDQRRHPDTGPHPGGHHRADAVRRPDPGRPRRRRGSPCASARDSCGSTRCGVARRGSGPVPVVTAGIVTAMAQKASGRYFAGKRCFLTGAASGIGRATALRLAAQGAELYLTDRNADGLAQTVADARALGAQVPEHRALDVSDYDEVAAFAADIHTPSIPAWTS